MKRNPLYSFRDRSSIGIFNVPLHSTIHIIDSDGNFLPIFVEIESKNGLSPTSTIGQFLDDPTLYIDLSRAYNIPSELEKITEGPLNNTGWAIFGRNPDNYGDIGQNAIDMSFSTTPSTTYGATGQNSFATGVGTTSSGISTTALGIGTIASQNYSTTLGKYNDDSVQYVADKVLVVGIGTDQDLKNGLIVLDSGQIIAPELKLVDITNGTPDMLVTKEYSDIIDGGNII